MTFQFIVVKDGIELALIPENEMEKALIKGLGSQENVFTEVSKGSSSGAIFNDGTFLIKKNAKKSS
jgi:hypothetical protein